MLGLCMMALVLGNVSTLLKKFAGDNKTHITLRSLQKLSCLEKRITGHTSACFLFVHKVMKSGLLCARGGDERVLVRYER